MDDPVPPKPLKSPTPPTPLTSPGRPDPSDAELTPELDPAVEAQVRALLASAPGPGPMPDDVAGRIAGALTEAARLRVEPGPLVASGTPGTPDDALGADVVSMRPRRDRPRPVYLAAAVAAAAVVVAAGASALHLVERSNGAALVGDTVGATASPAPSTSPSGNPTAGAPEGTTHIQLSTTAYDAGNLPVRARELLEHPAAPLPDLAAEAPHIGPIGTPIGLRSCLAALGVSASAPVSADLATYAGQPAAIIVVTLDGTNTAWAVERTCREGAPGVLKDATPVP